jgi:hypothetical protein
VQGLELGFFALLPFCFLVVSQLLRRHGVLRYLLLLLRKSLPS